MADTQAGGSVLHLAQAGGQSAAPGGEAGAPRASDDCIVTAEDTALTVGVLDNDSDPDGDPLNLLSTTQPAGGEVEINPDGSLTITPADPGLQTFRYQAGDGQGNSDFADVTVLVNPVAGELAQPVLQGLSDQEVARVARACAAGSALEVDSHQGAQVEVPVPAPGHRAHVVAEPGQQIQLRGGEYAGAAYFVVDGGLLVITDQGHVTYIAGLVDAAESDAPPTLSAAGGPAVPTDALLARLEPVGEEAEGVGRVPTPEAGPAHGGGAGFEPFDPGALPPGLDPLGPQFPTALGAGDEFLLRDPGATILAVGPEPPEPANRPATIDGTSLITREAGEATITPEFDSGPLFPELAEETPLPLDRINGVDPQNLVIGPAGDATITFVDEVAKFGNSLGVYLIDPATGEIVDPEFVFPFVERAESGEDPNVRPGGGPLRPGDQVELSDVYVPAQLVPGTQFGLFLLADGFRLNETLEGDLSFVRPDGTTATIDDLVPPELRLDGETLLGDVFHTVDSSPGTPLDNPLNDGGGGQAVSGLREDASGLTIGFEDMLLNRADPGDPSFDEFDNDFNDVLIDVDLTPTATTVFAGGDIEVATDAVITDPDDADLAAAVVEITSGAQPGDSLLLGMPPPAGISLVEETETRLAFEGTAPVETYQALLRSVQLEPAAATGTREVSLTVTDARGAVSEPFVVTVDLTGAGAQFGTPGDDVLVGDPLVDDAISGRGGNDALFGDSGDDLLSGGTGRDVLEGGEGDDQLIGGPEPDSLTGGPGADEHVYLALADRGDTVVGFDATEGDVLNFAALFDGAADAGPIRDFVQFDPAPLGSDVRVSVDLDGGGGDFAQIPYLTLADPTGITPGPGAEENAVANGALVV